MELVFVPIMDGRQDMASFKRLILGDNIQKRTMDIIVSYIYLFVSIIISELFHKNVQ